MRARILCALLVALSSACSAPERAEVHIEIAVPSFDGVEGGAPVIEPPEALLHLGRRGPGRYEAVLDRERVIVRAPGACPEPSAPFVRLAPLFTIEGERAQIGFGQRFELSAEPQCDEAHGAWSSDTPIDIDGLVVRGVMPALSSDAASGVIPISHRTRGTRTLRFTMGDVVRTIELHAAARATGVPSVPTNTRVYLRGAELEILGRPRGSVAQLERVDERTSAFIADARGRYILSGGFTVFAGSHAATDLDCGRAECHASVASHIAPSPMTRVFARLMEDESYTPGCAVGCHSAGDPGVDDGGFEHVARELGAPLPEHGGEGAYERLPRELRRLGSVGCTSCHGPGAIPEPGASARIRQTDVCAICHDAPPRYGHVLAWRSTRMSTPRGGASEGSCARCHTAGEGTREITCIGCHVVHGESVGALLRSEDVCADCHSVDRSLDVPTASAVALVRGTDVYGPNGALSLDAPHAAQSCVACHGSAPIEGIERGASHAFGVAQSVCRDCHGREMPEPADLRARIDALAARVGPTDHANAGPGPPSTDQARARWNVGLLANDRGAWAHGGRTLPAILDATEALLAE
jgi:predicted CXXCH cytochrome family protein